MLFVALLSGKESHHSFGECPNAASQCRPSETTRFPSLLAGMAATLRLSCLLEVQEGFLALSEKSKKKFCPVQGGLEFPIPLMWQREVTRASFVLKSKGLVCPFLL